MTQTCGSLKSEGLGDGLRCAIPKLRSERFPERHMGLVPTAEHAWAREAVEAAAAMATDYLDLEGLWRLADAAPALFRPDVEREYEAPASADKERPRIGVVRDSAQGLGRAAELVEGPGAGGLAVGVVHRMGKDVRGLETIFQINGLITSPRAFNFDVAVYFMSFFNFFFC